MDGALKIYRENFRPSAAQAQPYTMVSTSVIASSEPGKPEAQACSLDMAMLRMFTRRSFKLLPPEEVHGYRGTPQEHAIIDSYVHRSLTGTGAEVVERLARLQQRTGADELMMVTMGTTRGVELETIEEVARHATFD